MKMDKDILVGKVSALLRVWEGIGEIGHGRKVRGWMALITELKKKKRNDWCKKLIISKEHRQTNFPFFQFFKNQSYNFELFNVRQCLRNIVWQTLE